MNNDVTKQDVVLYTHADAGFGEDESQTGIATFMGENMIDWRSIKQTQVPRSTAEAEITALALGGIVIEGFQALLEGMYTRIERVTLYGDNQASICLTVGQGSWRTRCLNNRANGLRCRIQSGELEVLYVRTGEQRADGLTKLLCVTKLQQARLQFGIVAPPGK